MQRPFVPEAFPDYGYSEGTAALPHPAVSLALTTSDTKPLRCGTLSWGLERPQHEDGEGTRNPKLPPGMTWEVLRGWWLRPPWQTATRCPAHAAQQPQQKATRRGLLLY